MVFPYGAIIAACSAIQNSAKRGNEEKLNVLVEKKAEVQSGGQPKIGGWIPCSERLPEDTETGLYDMQLVTLDNGDVCLGVYRHDDKEWLARMSEGETKYRNKHKVIAWQPLPEAYL